MDSWLNKLILLVILVAVVTPFANPKLEAIFHGCGMMTTSDEGHHSKSEKSSSQGEGCDCPIHCSSCHQSFVYFKIENRSAYYVTQSRSDYQEGDFSIKPGPFLEGPFQPPRA